MNKKGFVPIVVLIAVVALVVGGGAWYYFSQRSAQPVANNPSYPSSSVPSGAVPASPTYSNPKYGFAIELPSNYAFLTTNVSAPGGYMGPMSYDQKSTNFLTSTGAVVLGGFEVPSGIIASTTTTGALVGLSVNPTITDNAACSQFASVNAAGRDGPSAYGGTIVVNNVTYRGADLGLGAAMSHSEGITYLHTLQHGMCYEVSLDVQTAYGYEVMPPSWDSEGALKSYLAGIEYTVPTGTEPIMVTVEKLARNPGDYLNKKVQVTGKVILIGKNYFTDPRFAVTDGTDTFPINAWTALETPPPGPGQVGGDSATMQAYLDKTVTLQGIVYQDNPGILIVSKAF